MRKHLELIVPPKASLILVHLDRRKSLRNMCSNLKSIYLDILRIFD